jgi:hypothetical protein
MLLDLTRRFYPDLSGKFRRAMQIIRRRSRRIIMPMSFCADHRPQPHRSLRALMSARPRVWMHLRPSAVRPWLFGGD